MKIDLRKIFAGLQRHAGVRLTVPVLIIDGRAGVHPVDTTARRDDPGFHLRVDTAQGFRRHQPTAHTALIGDHDDGSEEVAQKVERPWDAVAEFKLVEASDIAPDDFLV